MNSPAQHTGRLLEVCLLDKVGSAQEDVESALSSLECPYATRLTCVSSVDELHRCLDSRVFAVLIMHMDAVRNSIDAIDLLHHYGRSSTYGHVIYLRPSPADAELGLEGDMRVSLGNTLHLLPFPLSVEALREVLDAIVQHIDQVVSTPLLFQFRNRVRPLRPESIVYVESNRRVLFVHCEREVIRVYGKLSELGRKLPSSFVHCHKSYLLNMDYIDELGSDYARTSTGETVPVSQKKRRETKGAYDAYVRRAL